MVNAQVYAVFQFRTGLGQHGIRRHIHSHKNIAFLGRGFGQSLRKGEQQGGEFRVFQEPRLLAQLPPTPAKGRGRTHGVAVRLAVGQDQKPVMGRQEIRSLKPRQCLHGRSPGS